jgi:signal transduction histidine kinase
MTVILANAELALHRSRTPDQYRATLSAIQQESNHILVMLEDMLLAARTAGAEQAIEKLPVAFDALVSEVFHAAQATAAMKQQTLRMEEPEGEELWVLGDRSLLRRMVSSLLDNALKYTPAGGRITLTRTRAPHGFVFSVEDNGIGIAPEMQGRVFDRLFRADAARSRKELPGSGLGLSILKGVAQVHGFAVHLQSEVHRGTTFSIDIPASAMVSAHADRSSAG